jgi:hypothetical protein
MNWSKILRRWTMKSVHAAILSSALLGSASVVVAQTPSVAANKLPGIHYTRSQTFDLPVVMDKSDRLTLSEIRLYVKTPTTGWTLMEKGSQELTRFSCKVTQDGEYWYTLALVDRAGQMTPADLNLVPPSQRVVVDTVVPVVQVESTNVAGELCLRCTVQDANADQTTLKAVCKTESGEYPLESVPNQPGVFRVKGAELMKYPVVVSAKDLAGNVGLKEVNVREMIGSTLSPAPKGPPEIALIEGRPEPKGTDLTAPRIDLPPPRTEGPPMLKNEAPPMPRIETPPLPKAEVPPLPGPISRAEYPPVPVSPPAPMYPPPLPELPTKVTTPAIESLTPAGTGPQQLINTTHATVEYRLDQVGPSGVGKVEIYMTPDKGQSWHRLGEDSDKRSPAEINLPGDGSYGIRIVVTNGNGFGGKAPVRGDQPHCTIEVDTTSPFVQLRSTEVMPSSGQVEIRWNATDRNLGTEPVSLHYRTRTDGPWQLIARGVKNDGMHRWAFPRDVGSQFFFKVEVTDLAGNMSQAVSSQAITIDMAEPQATVVGVTGSAVRPRTGGN